MTRRLGALLPLLALGACGTWLGDPDAPPLPGERLPVLLLERELAADPTVAAVEVRVPAPQTNAEWPQSGGSATHAMHHLTGPERLSQAWRTNIGPGSGGSRQLLARPVVAEGRVYTMAADGAIGAFDTRNGNRLWRHRPRGLERASGPLGGGLAFGGGWLFATTASGEVVALEGATGDEVWHRSLTVPVRSAPTLAGNQLLVLSADNQLFALDAQTGRTLWRHAGFPELAGLLGGANPAAVDGIAVVPYSSGEVFALRLEDGQPLWADAVQRPRRITALAEINDIIGNPVIDRERVYVAGHGGQMAVLDLRRGMRIWDADVVTIQTPWVAGDMVYTVTTRGEVIAFLRQDGRARWVTPLPRVTDPDNPDARAIHWAGPILAGHRLLLASSHGQAVSLAPETGEVLERINLPGPVSIPPIVAEGTVYILTDRGDLIAYR